MKKRRPSNSIRDEPHLQPGAYQTDPTERTARPSASTDPLRDSVWNEPTAVAPPGDCLELSPYAQWMLAGRRRYGWLRSWLATLTLAAVAAPLAIVSAFWGTGQTVFSALALTVFGPLVEEMGKIMAALMVVEKWPYVFRHPLQIVFCGAVAGAAFAAMENLLYLNVYIAEPSPELIRWRWTVCVWLHVGCSLIASWGVVRIWQDAWRRQGPPRLETGTAWWVTAIVIHGAYNGLAILFETLLSPF